MFLLTVVALLASCIDGSEEYWIDSNGGGRAEIRYSVPASFARIQGGDAGIRKMIGHFLKDTPAIRTSACEVVTENNITRVTLHVKFDSALKLADIGDSPSIRNLPAAASHLLGEIELEIKVRTVGLTRTITPAQAIPGITWMPDSSFTGQNLSYIIHLPAPASESSATRTEDGGRTLIWEFPLVKTLKSPAKIHFKMEIPIPWKMICAVSIPLALLCVWIIRRKNRRHDCL